jgi:hypothetical protein
MRRLLPFRRGLPGKAAAARLGGTITGLAASRGGSMLDAVRAVRAALPPGGPSRSGGQGCRAGGHPAGRAGTAARWRRAARQPHPQRQFRQLLPGARLRPARPSPQLRSDVGAAGFRPARPRLRAGGGYGAAGLRPPPGPRCWRPAGYGGQARQAARDAPRRTRDRTLTGRIWPWPVNARTHAKWRASVDRRT